MREGGASFREIAAVIGVNEKTVRNWCRAGAD